MLEVGRKEESVEADYCLPVENNHRPFLGIPFPTSSTERLILLSYYCTRCFTTENTRTSTTIPECWRMCILYKIGPMWCGSTRLSCLDNASSLW